MKFLAFTLLATAAFASPNPANGQKYIRRSANRQSKAAKLISDQVVSSNAAADDVQSANWGGAVLTADTATYTSVTGTFTISAPSGLFDTDEECAFVWVGIDGASSSCQGLLQTGVNLCTNEGVISFTGWYEYFPAPMSDFSDITFSAGDSVTLTATVTSSTSGVLTITNNSKNVTVSQAVTFTSALCQESAEWIVEQCDDCDVIDS
ncbi:peptidase A4 family-domain-containing protein [Rhodocollybia butyracea]|uniref:Peptidase A4 family-domain-containing protein n=1 Tax=Rhodocollybia butyracea TaxID=206335 RepID=A0A9P5U3J8_9AGAR|nr:peptidase A4 family-domain-containing protein [Rhodocollybia butyracea]